MTKEEWQKLHDELNDLFDEFISKWRKNNFKYNTDRKRNDDRVNEIISLSVNKIQYNKEITDNLYENQTDDYKTYMNLTGLWVETVYYSYIQKVLRFIESKIEHHE